MFDLRNISDGVRLVSIKTGEFKTVKINVSMAVPLNENAAVNSLLAGLLKRSCKAYPDFSELNGKLDELYGAAFSAGVSKIGDAQVISLSATCLDDKFSLDSESIVAECVQLLLSMIFEPDADNDSFCSDKLELEKRLLSEEILEEKNDKRSYAFTKCIEIMCSDEPFGRSRNGSIEEVQTVTPEKVYIAWKNIIETAIFQITVVGNTDIDLIEKMFKERFSTVDRKPCLINTYFSNGVVTASRFEEKIPANQGKLVMGYRTSMKDCDDNLFANRVMVDIFGGGTYSKLFTIIREKMSLAYYCSSRLISSKGIVFVQSGIDTEKESAVTEGVKKQLADVVDGNFDDEIIASSKRSIKEGLSFSDPDAYCGWYSSQILDENIMTPEEMTEGIEKVTREDICAAASGMKLDTVFMLSAECPEEETDGN